MIRKLILTENDLHKLLEQTVKNILKEYVGDEEEFGRYDIYDDEYMNMPEDEYDSLQQQLAMDDEMEEMAKDMDADQYVGEDYWDPGYYGR